MELLQTEKKYLHSLHSSIKWLQKSIDNKTGGSRAHIYLWGSWAAPYPETTGYIIPTFLDYYSRYNSDPKIETSAIKMGEWLLGLQYKEGSFPAGQIKGLRANSYNPSVFNTAQILDGLTSLYVYNNDQKWIESALNGAIWLADNVDINGIWNIGNYREGFNPSYYSQVVWPMLKVWEITKENKIKNASEKVLDRIVKRINEFGVIEDWGFDKGSNAFTHTIAYTIRGFQESAFILNEFEKYFNPLKISLEKFIRKAELTNGEISGLYDSKLSKAGSFVCLTGNSQLALCLMKYYEIENDLRILNAAFKLIDYVIASQHKFLFQGAIPGSKPIYGKYMFLRFPNWASKYHAESIMKALQISEELHYE